MRNKFIAKVCLKAYRMHLKRLSKGKRDVLRCLLGDKSYFKLRSWMDILSVTPKYTAVPQKGALKSITMVFNGDVYNVGLADRLRAVTSVYYWCKNNGIDFKLFFSSPFNLSDYLAPNEYNWETESEKLDRDRACPKALISYSVLFGEKKNIEFHREYLDSLLTCGYAHIHLYSNTFCYDAYFNACYHELFRPVEQLQSELDGFQKEIGDSYVSVSFRFTQLLGDLKDTFGTVLPPEERKALIQKCKDSIAPLLDENGVKIALVTSDSKSFLDEISGLPYVYLIPGSVGHIRNKVSEEQIRKTFWDMLMISRAKKAYMVRTPQMYRSGFAKHAALIGDIPFEEVVLD